MSRLRNWALNAVLVLVSLAIAFASGEAGLRLFGYHGENYLAVENTILVDDPVLNWRQRPNSVSYFNDVVYAINSEGFRDRGYSREKPANVFRIFVASDSVGYGTNVKMEDSYPKILESTLNSLGQPRRYEVINYSMPGLSIKQKLHVAQVYGPPFNPDLYIIDYVPNDVEFESRKRPESEANERCRIELIRLPFPCGVKASLKQSALVFFLSQVVEQTLQRVNWEDRNRFYDQVEGDYYQRLYRNPEKQQYLRTVFGEIEKFRQTAQRPILMPVFPVIYDYRQYKWGDINARVLALCEEHALPHVSLLEDYGKFDYNELRVQRGDFTHPSVLGNRIAAEAIARALVQQKLVPRAN
jgi:lysophospholipase L1-like esterase